jgi:hypothetical protein
LTTVGKTWADDGTVLVTFFDDRGRVVGHGLGDSYCGCQGENKVKT